MQKIFRIAGCLRRSTLVIGFANLQLMINEPLSLVATPPLGWKRRLFYLGTLIHYLYHSNFPSAKVIDHLMKVEVSAIVHIQ